MRFIQLTSGTGEWYVRADSIVSFRRDFSGETSILLETGNFVSVGESVDEVKRLLREPEPVGISIPADAMRSALVVSAADTMPSTPP